MKKLHVLFSVPLLFLMAFSFFAIPIFASETVYVTPKGKAYHEKDCRSLSRSKQIIAMSVEKANNQGYRACKICTPKVASTRRIETNKNASTREKERHLVGSEKYVRSISKLKYELSASSSPNKQRTKTKKWQALCVGISDGDTIKVLNSDNQEIRIRLYGIDTPEKKQAFGTKATQITSGLVFQKFLSIQTIDIDHYGRQVAVVELPNGTILQEHLLDQGMAWAYPQYCKKDFCDEWEKKEEYAQSELHGLWQDKNAIPPWKWRRKK